jgi:hypothetical protein
MPVTNHLEALRRRHQVLEENLRKAMAGAHRDGELVQRIKVDKLRIKDTIGKLTRTA